MPPELKVMILHRHTDKLRELGELVRALEITAAERGVGLIFVPEHTPRVQDVLVLAPGRMHHELVRILEAFPLKTLPQKSVSQKKLWSSNILDNARNKANIQRGRRYVIQARVRRRKR